MRKRKTRIEIAEKWKREAWKEAEKRLRDIERRLEKLYSFSLLYSKILSPPFSYSILLLLKDLNQLKSFSF
jgi:hypothetical protein